MVAVDILNNKQEKLLETKISSLMVVYLNLYNGILTTKEKMTVMLN